MARQRPPAETQASKLPACYAIVQPGFEEVAADEIEKDLKGTVRKTLPGIVVFRVDEIDDRVLKLRTTEDVFLLAWGSDDLSYRAADLEQIEKWTARKPDWQELLRIHHTVRPRPKGKPTYRLVAQMEGKHVYMRKDAGKAMARGLTGVFPDSWQPAEEKAGVEVWLTIEGPSAVCGMRLSDRSMRHRTYKLEHRTASLRPTCAAAMVRLAGAYRGQTVIDPMCGAGTILAEQLAWADRYRGGISVFGGDVDYQSVRSAEANLRTLGRPLLCRWDATRLPLADESVDAVVSNPPFGKQLSTPEQVGPLYRAMTREYDRVLKPGGVAVLLVADQQALREVAERAGWRSTRVYRVLVLGQMAHVSVWRKPS